MIYKYLTIGVMCFLLLGFQDKWKCLEDGLEEIISKPIEYKVCPYKTSVTNSKQIISINNRISLVLTKKETNNENYILFDNKRFKINTKIKNGRINYDLQSLYKFAYKDTDFYLFELNSVNGLNLNSKSLNLVVLISKDKLSFPFCEWNLGNNLSNNIGMNNGKLFILNNKADSIKYYEFKNNRFVHNFKNSVKYQNDSIGRICVPADYGF